MGISLRSFERHVQPHVRVIRVGTLRLFKPADLERFTEQNAAVTLEAER